MKKNLFIILTTTITILLLIYLYNQKEELINKQYINNTNIIHIEYPYFNNRIIDNYINTYLNSHINTVNNDKKIFIDYDYKKERQNILLTMYIHKEKNNLIKEEKKSFKINLSKEIITTIKENNEKEEYDIYYQKIIDKEKPMIALTFDDGPNYNTNKILDILEKYHIKATFFILGTNIKGNEQIIKRMKNQKMEIGNHMYSHKLSSKLTENQIKEEIKKVDDEIKKITGTTPTLLRPSYGSYNSKIKKIANRPIIIWNIDTQDWKNHNSKLIEKRVINKVSDGDIILMHDIYTATSNSLEKIIPKLIKNNYQFTTVTELLYYKKKEIKEGKIYKSIK